MLKIMLVVVGMWCLIGLMLFAYAIYTAKEIDPNSPFLNGDYDPAKDPTLIS
jgi:hypothetical protein